LAALNIDLKNDFLTDFYVKEAFEPLVDKIMAECGIRQQPFSILIVDLDHFKYFNDKFGHLNGDDVIKYFANSLRQGLYAVEYTAVRFGGDEFILIFPGMDSAQTHIIANDLSKALSSRPYAAVGRLFNMRFSGGIASYPDDGNDAKKLFDKADKAMYFSKARGRNKTTEFSKMGDERGRHLFFMSVAILLASIVVFAALYLSKSRIPDIIKNLGSIKLGVGQINNSFKERDVVHMKSGSIFRGRILREDEAGVEMKMKFPVGEGSMVLRKTDIKKIERGNGVPGE